MTKRGISRECNNGLTFKNQSVGPPWWSNGWRAHLAMQGTSVWPLVQEDPTRHGATKPVCRNYWASALEPVSCQLLSQHAAATEALVPRVHALQREASAMRKCVHHHEGEPLLSAARESLCTATKTPRHSQK